VAISHWIQEKSSYSCRCTWQGLFSEQLVNIFIEANKSFFFFSSQYGHQKTKQNHQLTYEKYKFNFVSLSFYDSLPLRCIAEKRKRNWRYKNRETECRTKGDGKDKSKLNFK
jgi:hypothetical protein